MVKLSELKQDKDMELAGVWRPFYDGKVLLARMNNSKMRPQIERMAEKYKRVNLEALKNDKVGHSRLCELIARFVIIDWEGFLDENDQPIPYTWEVGKAMLEDESNEEFIAFVLNESSEMDNYRKELVESVAGEPLAS